MKAPAQAQDPGKGLAFVGKEQVERWSAAQIFQKKSKKTLAFPGSLCYHMGAIEMTGALRPLPPSRKR